MILKPHLVLINSSGWENRVLFLGVFGQGLVHKQLFVLYVNVVLVLLVVCCPIFTRVVEDSGNVSVIIPAEICFGVRSPPIIFVASCVGADSSLCFAG